MTADLLSGALPAAHDAAPDPVELHPGRKRPRPSATRSASLSRARRVGELRRGNANALRHGLFAEVAHLPMVAAEVALQYVAHPGLDPIRDLRLVEHYALASIQLRRAHLEVERVGLTEHLGSFLGRQGTLVERLERMVDERERRNLAERARSVGDDRLGRYRSGDRP
jgi:hypothetical protein